MHSITLDFDVIVLSEIWSYNINLYSTLFAGYNFYYDLPVSGSVGGVGIYIKNTITQNQVNTMKIQTTDDCSVENIWLEISKGQQKYIIGGIYRHPGQDIAKFSDNIEKIFVELKKLKIPCLIAGDMNIDLAKCSTHSPTNNYLENLLLYNLVPAVVMPSRITDQSATIIDHIYFMPGAKFNSNLSIQSGNLWCDITDHLANYCLLIRASSHQQKELRPFVRIYSASNIQKFKEKIGDVDWSELLNCTDANTAYMNFEQNISSSFNDCFKLVKLSRKRSKDKKWITAGILASCKTKKSAL